MTKLSLSLAVLMSAAPAGAVWFNGGVSQVGGSDNYRATTFQGTVGHEGYTVKPRFSTYRSDSSGGTFNTLSTRLGYEDKLFTVGLTGGGTGKVDGYSNRFFGLDAAVSLTPTGKGPEKRISGKGESTGPARGKGVMRVDLGAEIRHTVHTDAFSTSTPGSSTRGPGAPRALRASGPLDIGQTDMTASAGVSLLGNLLSFDVTKSRYTKNLATAGARAPANTPVSGMLQAVQGFPDASWTARFETSLLPLVTPFAQYTYTKFEIGQPDGRGSTVGAYLELGIVEASASYEHYAQAGRPGQNYFTVGGSLRF